MRKSLLFGLSGAIQKTLAECHLYAALADPLLILGEFGTGKSELAQHIHHLSGRRGAFVAASPANVPDGIAQSYLFGHRKGAYTGAHDDRIGVFEQANHGTILLDELAAVSPTVQTMLLSVLDRKAVMRAGETTERACDARVIAAMNVDPAWFESQGRSSRDLVARFGYLTLRLPPLRERQEDVIPLARHFISEFEQRQRDLDPALEAVLQAFPWPGNVRQLRNACRFASLQPPHDGPLRLEHFPREIAFGLPSPVTDAGRARRHQARRVVAACGGNKSRAARELSVSRPTLYSLIRPSGEHHAIKE
jgi:DNA-binding NtrC family response regulator